MIGPKPKWARKDGGDGGAHPSSKLTQLGRILPRLTNLDVIEYGYPVGKLYTDLRSFMIGNLLERNTELDW